MASELLREQALWHPVEIYARGAVVLFPEPVNQKAEAVMVSKGMQIGKFLSKQLEEAEVDENTLVLTFEEDMRKKLSSMFPTIRYLYVLTHITGDELEILNPIGGELFTYGICLESMEKSIKKLADVLNDGSYFIEEQETDSSASEEETDG